MTGNFRNLSDWRNTAEHLYVEGQKVGEQVFFAVRARNIPIAPQPYALVIVGDFENAGKGKFFFSVRISFLFQSIDKSFSFSQF